MDYTDLENENKRLRAKLEDLNTKKKEKWNKRARITKKISYAFLGSNLKNAISTFFNELEEKKSVSNNTISELLSAFLMRVTRIGIFLILTSLLPTLFLLIQVYYLRNQNKLITGQNERLGQQTNLQEADRRSSMLLVLDQMIKDVTTDGYKNNGRISRANSTRLIAMSKILKPYKYLYKDTLIAKPVSPERGYLMLSLLESDIKLSTIIDNSTQKTLASALNLKYAELTDATITSLDLKNIDLSHSNMDKSNFTKSNLYNINFYNASLKNTIFSRSDITKSNLKSCNLQNANFKGVTLKNINFENAILKNVNFSNSDLINVNLKNATIIGAKFNNTSVPTNWIKTQKEKLNSKNFNYLEDHYKLKIHNKKGILVAK